MKAKKLNKLLYPIAALLMLTVLLFTATYSWMSNQATSKVESGNDYITIDPDSGLEMNYGSQDMNQSVIDINKVVKEDFMFYECSSYNGKRIFFPISEYSKDSDGDKDFVDAKTKDFIYREATVGDKNTKYISIDLSLFAKEDTPVWLHKDSKITGGAKRAMRIAFIDNDPGGNAIIFDDSEPGYTPLNTAIDKLNSDGSASTSNTDDLYSMKEYIFGNQDENKLFELKAGVEKRITVNIWLEGTDADCTSNVASLSDLGIYIKFSTTTEEEKTYYFVDHTLEKWIFNDYEEDTNYYIFAIDTSDGTKYPMRRSDNYDNDHTWIVDLRASIKSLQFARYNPELHENNTQEWNIWDAGEIGSCTTYNAFAHNTGIWDDSFQYDTITWLDGTANHKFIDKRYGVEVIACYTATDGNGNSIDFAHKMSNQWERNRWVTNIPASVSDITFKWAVDENSAAEYTWEAPDRGDGVVFTATGYTDGYWGDKMLYLDSSEGAGLADKVIYVAYFFGNDGEIGWSSMMGTTEKGRYMVGVPDGATKVIFCRYNEQMSGFDWTGVYNQTRDLDITNNNLYKLSGYDANDRYYMTGTWYVSDNP